LSRFLTLIVAPQQLGLPATGPGNRDTAIAVVRFRFAPPTDDNGGGSNNALTIKPDHSVGADQKDDAVEQRLTADIVRLATNYGRYGYVALARAN
jgi:hypothetical protein